MNSEDKVGTCDCCGEEVVTLYALEGELNEGCHACEACHLECNGEGN